MLVPRNIYYHQLSADVGSPTNLSDTLPKGSYLIGVVFQKFGSTADATLQLYLDGVVFATITAPTTASASWWAGSQVNDRDEQDSTEPPSWPQGMPYELVRDNDGVSVPIKYDLTMSGGGGSPICWLVYAKPNEGVQE